MTPKHSFAKILSRSGLLTEAQLEQALQLQAREGSSIAEAAAKLSFASEQAVLATLATALHVPVASRENGLLVPKRGQGLESLVPAEVARRHHLLPLFTREGCLAVAMEDPMDLFAADELHITTGLTIVPHIASAKELRDAIDAFYGGDEVGIMQALGNEAGIREDTEITDFRNFVLPGLGAGGRGIPDVQGGAGGDPVDCTVFAPPQASVGESLLVQVFAHLPEQAAEVLAAAIEFDDSAKRRGATALGTRIRRGSRLTFELASRGLQIREPARSIIWQGRPASVQFDAEVSAENAHGTVIAAVTVSQDSVPIGEVKFKLNVVCSAAGSARKGVPAGEARRYQTAFVSYASQDRPEVLRRVQMLAPAGIRFFQDVLDLEPGQRWSDEIFKRIDESDVMFLFWSTAAKNSEWVQREWRYGLERRGVGFIKPVILEGPPIPPPPQDLSEIHFNDKVLYFIKA
jgi:hypothetical protein